MKGIPFAEARKLQAMMESGQIIRPDQAKESELNAYKTEWQNIWHFRDQFLDAALSGGHPATIATLDAAEELAKETMRRRLLDVVQLAEVTGATINEGTRFVAKVLGVAMPEKTPGATQPAATESPVINLHG